MAFLRVVLGPQKGREYPLSGAETIVGRHPACQIVIDIGAVSRQHARIVQQSDGFWAEDLQSRNGTLINDHRITTRTRLESGDELKICDVAFQFIDPSAADPSSVGSRLIRARGERQATPRLGNTVLIDESSHSGNTSIMSSVEVSSNHQRAQLQATPQAKLRALFEISQALGKVLSLDDVFPKVLDSLFRIFVQADRGFIVMRDDQGELVPRWSKTRLGDTHQTMRISRDIVNHVLTTRQAVLSADAASDERFDVSQSVARLRIRSFMCAPLIDGEGKALGVIQLDSLDLSRKFQDEDLEVLATVALQAGIAIDNAQLHEAALRQRELARDLELAHEVQHGFLPLHRPKVEGYEFFDFYDPANHVGGDFFDYVTLPDGRLAVIVADVVGHGIAAALLMAKISSEARFSLAIEADLARAARRLNRALSELQLDRFVTMVIGLLDPGTARMSLVNAGHMAPLRRLASGEIQQPGKERGGLPLGVIDDFVYEASELELAPGDQLVFMTDGIFECADAHEEQLGLDRVRTILSAEGGRSAEASGNAIVRGVRQHLGRRAPDDDMCLVCLHFAGVVSEPKLDDAKREDAEPTLKAKSQGEPSIAGSESTAGRGKGAKRSATRGT